VPEEKEKGICRQVSAQPEPALEPVAEAPALTRDAILLASDRKTQRVPCPEWGGAVLLRTMTGAARDAFEQLVSDRRKGERIDIVGMKAEVIVRSACDEAGVALFTPKDVAELNAKSAKPLDRLFKVAQTLSGLTDDDVEELAGN